MVDTYSYVIFNEKLSQFIAKATFASDNIPLTIYENFAFFFAAYFNVIFAS